ncbi:hypothetical protein GCM10027277_08680 [Pseudoduganella ginsengisoli]|uniref:Uncharacterized protein n=1 Tax=Pseudoduganella ginsengisoli TaxID=1462440 RepID=A0A6L6PZX3_9BURK|nr:hypothetical protein [Pseudoduganella ginsengisoli]MTW03193.1 hypothetical protein [Pseudoduganella ginsengisoli]
MTISSVTSSSAASQAAWVSQAQNNSGAGNAGAAHRPPPPPDGGGLVGAIADALQSIGVTATGAADGGSATGSTDTRGNAAQALGSFLHELMGALHEQGASAQAGGPPPDGQSYGPPGGGQGGSGGPGGGPGRLSADLQSLIAKLGSSSTDSSSSADSAGSTSTESSASSALQNAFSNLLQALGTDASDPSSKLNSFLQTLADKLPSAGSSGNLINTSV